MLINGEKYACDACVRGHRVSSCQHAERPLIHINKKGRPVSQCPHCRGLRKARAQHVKCDCAEKAHSKEDCPFEKGEVKGDHQKCCCTHGSRCTCSLKKEHHLDTVPEDIPPAILAAVLPKEPIKPRLVSQISQESKPTMFANGHHKPVHKANDMHSKCGAPYKIPSRAHTIHGHKESTQRFLDNLPMTKGGMLTSEAAQYHDTITSAPQPVRRAKSEHASPVLGATSTSFLERGNGMIIPPLDPTAYPYSQFGSGSPSSTSGNQQEYRFPEKFPDNYFVSYEMATQIANPKANEWEPPLYSGGLNETPSEVDWSSFNFPFGNGAPNGNNNGTLPSQPPSYASFDHYSHFSHPGLTSSSGEISEIEDFIPVSSRAGVPAATHEALDDFSSVGGQDTPETEQYRLSSASSYIGMPQVSMLANGNLESLDIDEYLKRADAQTREMALQYQHQQQQYPVIGIGQMAAFNGESNTMEHPYSVQEAQSYAHMARSSSDEIQDRPSLPVTATANDPMWSYQPPQTPNGMLGPNEQDEDWVP